MSSLTIARMSNSDDCHRKVSEILDRVLQPIQSFGLWMKKAAHSEVQVTEPHRQLPMENNTNFIPKIHMVDVWEQLLNRFIEFCDQNVKQIIKPSQKSLNCWTRWNGRPKTPSMFLIKQQFYRIQQSWSCRPAKKKSQLIVLNRVSCAWYIPVKWCWISFSVLIEAKTGSV